MDASEIAFHSFLPFSCKTGWATWLWKLH